MDYLIHIHCGCSKDSIEDAAFPIYRNIMLPCFFYFKPSAPFLIKKRRSCMKKKLLTSAQTEDKYPEGIIVIAPAPIDRSLGIEI